MTPRTRHLRQESLEATPSISPERAVLLTEFYRENDGRWSLPVTRSRSFRHLCEHKTLFIGDGELIVGERGPCPKAVPTFPELTCHSVEDLEILNTRPKTGYAVDADCLRQYAEVVVPYWEGRSMRDKIFRELPEDWQAAYGAGVFTEFMEQRAPGHTVLDDKIYTKGMREFREDIARELAALDWKGDPEAWRKQEALRSFDIACEAVIIFAERHAVLAREMAAVESDSERAAELERIADGGVGAGVAGVLLCEVQQPHRTTESGGDGGGERDLHGLFEYQHRWVAGGWDGRIERGVTHPVGHHRRDASAATEFERAAFQGDIG